MNEIYNRLNEVFREVFDDDSITVNAETTAADIEDWDSLTHIQLIAAVDYSGVLDSMMKSSKDNPSANKEKYGIKLLPKKLGLKKRP